MSFAVKKFLHTSGRRRPSRRPAVFCRFAGCNLWSGLERDRATTQCRFCDTDFVGTDGQNGGKFADAEALATAIAAQWPEAEPGADALVVFTGGEPCLQLNVTLLEAVAAQGFETAVETNGTCLCQRKSTGFVLVQNPKARLFNRRSRTEIRLPAKRFRPLI